MKICRRLKWMVPNLKHTGDAFENSIQIVPSIRPIYDSNLYNNQINNTIDEEKNISGLKSWSQVGVDLALVVNND